MIAARNTPDAGAEQRLLAVRIVDALLRANIVGPAEVEQALRIVANELRDRRRDE